MTGTAPGEPAATTPSERLDQFMARANAAYYATHDPFADFTTAPEIAQVFGEILGLWAAVTWEPARPPDPGAAGGGRARPRHPDGRRTARDRPGRPRLRRRPGACI